jgi:hypothetical protein
MAMLVYQRVRMVMTWGWFPHGEKTINRNRMNLDTNRTAPVTSHGSVRSGKHCKHSENSKDFVIDSADVLQDGKTSKMELTLGFAKVQDSHVTSLTNLQTGKSVFFLMIRSYIYNIYIYI